VTSVRCRPCAVRARLRCHPRRARSQRRGRGSSPGGAAAEHIRGRSSGTLARMPSPSGARWSGYPRSCTPITSPGTRTTCSTSKPPTCPRTRVSTPAGWLAAQRCRRDQLRHHEGTLGPVTGL